MADTRTNDIIEAVIDLEKRFAALRAMIGVTGNAGAKAEKPKEEEVDALDGGMDMFGGGGAKTGDY